MNTAFTEKEFLFDAASWEVSGAHPMEHIYKNYS